MHPAITYVGKSVDLALGKLYTPQVLIPLVIALGVWWCLMRGSYMLAGESDAGLIEQATAFCAEKGGDFKPLPSMPPEDGRAELRFSCE